jgi:hypothetical protein
MEKVMESARNTDATAIAPPTCQERIDAIRKTKLEHTDLKIKQRGYHDIDDHGYIPWPEPIPFTPKSNHPSGGCYGAKCIGENFRAWLEVHPVYIHPMSALAGAWVGHLPGVGGWRPEDRATHLTPLHKKYNIISTGIGGMNHLGPDMKIGLDLGWGGLLRKIRNYRDLNRPPASSEMADFYDGEENLVIGIQNWMRKHVMQAREWAAAETNPFVRDNYQKIADMNEWLIDNPPRTLREACQFLAWFQSIDRMWAAGGALGQLDELLRPFYEADMANGIITNDDEVVWYIATLLSDRRTKPGWRARPQQPHVFPDPRSRAPAAHPRQPGSARARQTRPRTVAQGSGVSVRRRHRRELFMREGFG